MSGRVALSAAASPQDARRSAGAERRVVGVHQEARGAHRGVGTATGPELAELVPSPLDGSAAPEAHAEEVALGAQARWTARTRGAPAGFVPIRQGHERQGPLAGPVRGLRATAAGRGGPGGRSRSAPVAEGGVARRAGEGARGPVSRPGLPMLRARDLGEAARGQAARRLRDHALWPLWPCCRARTA